MSKFNNLFVWILIGILAFSIAFLVRQLIGFFIGVITVFLLAYLILRYAKDNEKLLEWKDKL